MLCLAFIAFETLQMAGVYIISSHTTVIVNFIFNFIFISANVPHAHHVSFSPVWKYSKYNCCWIYTAVFTLNIGTL